MKQDPQIYAFGDFRLDPSESLLLRNGVPVPLCGKVFATLLVLVRKSGHLVEKSELISTVWEGAFVEEGNIAVAISTLRKALGDDRNKHKYIETISKRGYRFVANVRSARVEASLAIQTKSESQITSECEVALKIARFGEWRQFVPMAATIGLLLMVGLMVIGLVAKERISESPRGARQPPSPRAQATGPKSKEVRDSEAHQMYLKGRYYANAGTQDGLRRSLEYFQQAVFRDPQYAEAYAGFADSYSLSAPHELEAPQEEYPIAKAAALKAVQLNGSLAESHTSLGMVYFRYEWDCSKAETEFRHSIVLNPNYGSAYIDYANCLAAEGRFDQALEQAQHLEDLNPDSAVASTEVSYIYFLSRQYEKSISALHHAIDLDPHAALPHIRLGLIYTLNRNYPDALQESHEADQLSPDDPRLEGLSGYIEASSGKGELARRRLAKLLERSKLQYTPAFSMALIYLGLGDRDHALNWLEIAYQERSHSLVYALVDPLLDSERSNERFVALLSKMGLPQARPETAPPSFDIPDLNGEPR